MRASDFYTETVLPTLAERLDHAFPEFGWRRDARGWVATNEQHTARILQRCGFEVMNQLG